MDEPGAERMLVLLSPLMASFTGRLTVALLTLALIWSGAQCAALCDVQPSASTCCRHCQVPCKTASTACHIQPFEADLVPGFVMAYLTASATAMYVVSPVEFLLPPDADAQPVLDVHWPPGLGAPPTIALRI
jgi:hypothetical protein